MKLLQLQVHSELLLGYPSLIRNKHRKSNNVLLHPGALTAGNPKWGGGVGSDDFPFENR